MKGFRHLILAAMFATLLSNSAVGQTDSKPSIRTFFDDESGRTTVSLNLIYLPKNDRNFAMGVAFGYPGKKLEVSPCCVSIAFYSGGKKDFEYKENHDVIFWADKKALNFEDTYWKENDHAMAFVLAGIAYPEEVWVGMKTEQFREIVEAKSVKVKVGNFTFKMTKEQHQGLADMLKRLILKPNEKPPGPPL